jgi:simple sugar transport system substrate-binding protein
MTIRGYRFAMLGALVLLRAATAQAQETFYFIAHAGPGDPYWTIQAKAAEEAGRKLGVRVIFSAPEKPGDVAGQVEILNAAVAARPAGIVTTLPDAKAFSNAIKRARKQGIPVIAVNTREAKRDAAALPYQAYVGMDELQAGRNVGQKALQSFKLKSGDLVVIANHQPGVMSLEQRTLGIRESLASASINTATLDISSNPTRAISVLQSFLKANANVKAILTLGPLGYTPAGKLLQEQKLAGKVKLGGFDIDPVGLDLIQKGVMEFSLDAQPYVQAFASITQLFLASRYLATPVDMNTGTGFFERSNVGAQAKLIQSGYEPQTRK